MDSIECQWNNRICKSLADSKHGSFKSSQFDRHRWFTNPFDDAIISDLGLGSRRNLIIAVGIYDKQTEMIDVLLAADKRFRLLL